MLERMTAKPENEMSTERDEHTAHLPQIRSAYYMGGSETPEVTQNLGGENVHHERM